MIKNKILSIMLSASMLIGATGVCTYAQAQEPTSGAVVVSVESDYIGNIFFGSTEPELDVTYENVTDSDVTFTVDYTVYGYDTKMSEDIIKTASRTLTVGANSIYTDTVKPEAEKFGVYKLGINISNSNGDTVADKKVDFSRSVIGKKNNTLGANTHLTTMGNMNQSLHLMNSAGMGLLRDGFRWYSYENVNGKAMPVRFARLAQLCSDYGIDFLPVIYAENSKYSGSNSEIVTDEDGLEAYYNFVKEILMSEEFTQHIKNVEICNEPDAHEFSAQEYVNVLKKAYQAKLDANSTVKIGAFSTYSVGTEKSLKFIKDSIALMDKPYYDATTAHPYLNYDYFDGDIRNYSLDTYNALFEGDFDKSERWYTEYGTTTQENSQAFVVENQYEQAVANIRAYNAFKKDRFNSKLYIYQLEDSATGGEESFGMLYSLLYDTPHAAKPAYLAVSNLNNIIADATSVTSIDDATVSGAYVDKYTCPDREVYMMYAKGKGKTVQKEYTLGNVVAYYDLFGNKINESELITNGKYNLTESPIYAVCNSDIEFVDEEDKHFTISGNTLTGAENSMVTLTVVEENTGFDEITGEDIIYFDQSFAEEGGSFSFEVELDMNKKYEAYIVSADSNIPVSLSLAAETKNNIELNMYSGISKVTSADLDVADLAKASVEVVFNAFVEQEEYKLFATVYNDGKLVGVKDAKGKTADGTNTYDMSGINVSEYDTIKLMLWDAEDCITPICEVVTFD